MLLNVLRQRCRNNVSPSKSLLSAFHVSRGAEFTSGWHDALLQPVDDAHEKFESTSPQAEKGQEQSGQQSQFHRSFFDTDSSLSRLKSQNIFLNPHNQGYEQDHEPITSSTAIAGSPEEVSALLEEAKDEGLLARMCQISSDADTIAALPSSTFVELLRRLDPGDEFLPFKSGFVERIPKHYYALKSRMVDGPLQVMKQRREMYMKICEQRVRYGQDLRVREYAQLLKCARATFDGRNAAMIMRAMLLKNLRPDLQCYNAYFEARCWSDTWCPNERQFIRVIPHHMRKRERDFRSRFGPYAEEVHPYLVGPQGLRKDITDTFTHMIDSGILADSEAFGHLMTALGREGDIEGVKAVLKNVWGVDVDLVGTADDECTELAASSPLYPDARTLFVVAHTFGSNNQFPTALRAVDYMSRKFDIQICKEVWAELLNWSFTLSTRRIKRRKVDGAQLGQVPNKTTDELWSLFTGPPYNCRPTCAMYDYVIRNLNRRSILDKFLSYMIEALTMLYAEQESLSASEESGSPKETNQGQRSADSQASSAFASYMYIQQWCELLLTNYRFVHSKHVLWWQREIIPDIVDIYWRYRRRKGINYNTNTGFVLLQE